MEKSILLFWPHSGQYFSCLFEPQLGQVWYSEGLVVNRVSFFQIYDFPASSLKALKCG